MNYTAITVWVSLLMSTSSFLHAESSVKPPAGFTAIFNGQDLTGWFGHAGEDPRELLTPSDEEKQKLWDKSMADVNQHWRVENGELINDGHGLFLTTKKNYRDFELHLEYRTVPGADSGIYLRGLPQVQIWDSTSTDPKLKELGVLYGSGGLWNNQARGHAGKNPLKKMDRPLGEWNQMKITMIGERVTVIMNGEKVVDEVVLENYNDKERKLPAFATGPIKLQTHGGEIRWRNIFLKEISADEANTVLRTRSGVGFTRLDTERGLDAWAGDRQSYEVVDGSIRCRDGQGGNLFTPEEYGDFQASLEFKLPPGGNNGIAIRYPGQGDAAYAAMTEIQILDDTAKKFSQIDPRQRCGSAYGFFAAQPGHLRTVGEWNHLFLTVKGSTVSVEMNGTLINEADLSTITSAAQILDEKEHPGLRRTQGHFGFAGHKDPVAFRQIWIKKL